MANMASTEQFSLCWDNFQSNLSSSLNSLLENEEMVDVTLAVEGKFLKAHRIVLSVCSPYFKELFKSCSPWHQPIIFMKDVSYVAMCDLLQFMYQGEVQVSQENLTTFIKTAEALQIKGLTADGNATTSATELDENEENITSVHQEISPKSIIVKSKGRSSSGVVPPPLKRAKLQKSNISHPSDLVTTPTATEEIHFKMEPYEQPTAIGKMSDSELPGDCMDDDTNGDNEDNEENDYSALLENDDEPQQEGSASDGGTATEGQGSASRTPMYHEGYTYGMYSGNTKMKIYMRCSAFRSNGCRGKGYMLKNKGPESFVLVTAHNHPPNFLMEKRSEITKTLKEFAATIPGKPYDVYSSVVSIYPEVEQLWPFSRAVRTINRIRQKTGFMRHAS